MVSLKHNKQSRAHRLPHAPSQTGRQAPCIIRLFSLSCHSICNLEHSTAMLVLVTWHFFAICCHWPISSVVTSQLRERKKKKRKKSDRRMRSKRTKGSKESYYLLGRQHNLLIFEVNPLCQTTKQHLNNS